jgi:hypothetical protein
MDPLEGIVSRPSRVANAGRGYSRGALPGVYASSTMSRPEVRRGKVADKTVVHALVPVGAPANVIRKQSYSNYMRVSPLRFHLLTPDPAFAW